jgi:hypothetical protein
VRLEIEDSRRQRTRDQAIGRLAGEFQGRADRHMIGRAVDASLRELEGARIQDFVPVLTYRFAREFLLGRAYGA